MTEKMYSYHRENVRKLYNKFGGRQFLCSDCLELGFNAGYLRYMVLRKWVDRTRTPSGERNIYKINLDAIAKLERYA